MQYNNTIPVMLPSGDGGLTVLGQAAVSEAGMVVMFDTPKVAAYLMKMLQDNLITGVAFEYRGSVPSTPAPVPPTLSDPPANPTDDGDPGNSDQPEEEGTN